VRDKLLQKIEILEPVALGGLALLVLLGLLMHKFDQHERAEAWLTSKPVIAEKTPSLWNWHVPGPVLGVVVLAGLVLFSAVALFLYYPAPHEAFADIFRVRADAEVAVKAGHRDEAIRLIQHWDLLTRKLQVGVFLRTGKKDPRLTEVTEDLRERLEDVRDALLAGNLDQAREVLPRVEEAYQRCQAAYRGEATTARY
jgi:uncharacterized protein